MKTSTVPAFVNSDTVDKKNPDAMNMTDGRPLVLEMYTSRMTGMSKTSVAIHVIIARLKHWSHGPRIRILPSLEGFVRRLWMFLGMYYSSFH